MATPKISVIIPVYNSEKYLEYCLASVLLQKYKNLDIICVNDGSTDNSLEILRKFATKDNRIKIVNQNNQGQSVARNNGMKLAEGEWISFVDSDDWINENLFKKFIKALPKFKEPDFDIFMFNGSIFPDNFILNFDIDDWEGKNPHSFDDCKNPFEGNLSACNKIYNREFLIKNNLTFTPNKIFEDQLFSTLALILAKGIYITNHVLYWYRQHDDSTMHSLENNVFDSIEILNKIKDALKSNNLWETTKYALLQHKYTLYHWLLFRLPYNIRKDFYNKAKEDLKNENDYDVNIIRMLKDNQLYFGFLTMEADDFYFKFS